MDQIGVILFLLVGASIAGTALMLFAKRRGGAKRDAIYALCEQNGWRFDETTDETGHIRITQITDRRDSWMLEEHFATSSETTATTRATTWTDRDTGIASGLAVMSLAMPVDRADDMEKFLGKMGGGKMEHHMVKTFFGAMGDGTDRLEAVHLPGAAGLMMATPDARDALSAIARHPDLASTATAMPKGAMPSVLRSPKGLQLQIKDTMASADQVAAMVRLGQALRASLRAD